MYEGKTTVKRANAADGTGKNVSFKKCSNVFHNINKQQPDQ